MKKNVFDKPGVEPCLHELCRDEKRCKKSNKKQKLLKEVAAHVAGGLILLAVLPLLVMWLWNALIPGIFAVSPIGFWQAAGLYLLARVLTCPLRARFDIDGAERRRHKRYRNHHHELHEQMHGMSREERREFIRRRMRSLCDEETAEKNADDAREE